MSMYYIKFAGTALGIISAAETIGVLVLTPVYTRLTKAYGWSFALLMMSVISLGGLVGAVLYR